MRPIGDAKNLGSEGVWRVNVLVRCSQRPDHKRAEMVHGERRLTATCALRLENSRGGLLPRAEEEAGSPEAVVAVSGVDVEQVVALFDDTLTITVLPSTAKSNCFVTPPERSVRSHR